MVLEAVSPSKPRTMSKAEEIFCDGDDFFRRIYSDLLLVQETLELEVYIFHLDDFGRSVADRLIQMAKRGIKVRILVDAAGSVTSLNELELHFKDTGVQLRFYHPFNTGDVSRLFNTFNRRNHRKTWILDGQVAFVGSLNICSEHTTSGGSNADAWKDYGIRIGDARVKELRAAYEKAWVGRRNILKRMSSFKSLFRIRAAAGHHSGVLLNDSYKLRRGNYLRFLRRIRNAKERVWLANSYFAPRPSLLQAMGHAARKGTDVRLILPHKSDVFFMPWLAATYYDQLLMDGVQIFEYLPRMHHAKGCLIDDWACIGSSNLNHRSIIHDLEVDIEVTRAFNRRILEQSFREELAQSKKIDARHWEDLPLMEKLGARILQSFEYWL